VTNVTLRACLAALQSSVFLSHATRITRIVYKSRFRTHAPLLASCGPPLESA